MASKWLGTYAYRKRIYVDATKIDLNLSYFPIPIILGTSVGINAQDVSDIFDAVGANYLKIAVTGPDQQVQLYCDVELWDNVGEKAVIHVSASTLIISSARATELYLYYDAAQIDNINHVGLSGSVVAQSVWDNSFEAVYHMNQDPSGGAGAVLDSTSNNNNGTSSGTMTTSDLVAGDIGKAIDFDGSDDLINCGSDVSLDNIDTLTVEVFSNLTAQTGTGATSEIIGKTNWVLKTDPSNSQNIFTANFADQNGAWSFPQYALSTWTHIAVVFDRTAALPCAFYTTDPCVGKIGLDLHECQTDRFPWWYANEDICYGLIGLDEEDCESAHAWWYQGLTPWCYFAGLEAHESKLFYYWVHEATVTGTVNAYFSGVNQTVTTITRPSGIYNTDEAASMLISNNAAQNLGLSGKIGEVRISSVLRSAAWLKATSYGLKDELIYFEDAAAPYIGIPTDICILDCTDPFGIGSYSVGPYDDCGDPCIYDEDQGSGGQITSGVLYSTGRNGEYQLLRSGMTDQNTFAVIDGSESVIDMSLMHVSGAFITASGDLYVIGTNAGGQLGTGDKLSVTSATFIMSDCIKVSMSRTLSTYVIKTDGSLWSCGSNTYGDLGVGDTTERLEFTQAHAGPFATMSGGYYGCFAIMTDGTLWATGVNGNGQLGFGVGDTTTRLSFAQVNDKSWTSVVKSGGGRFGLAITSAGELYGCGLGSYGVLCKDNTTSYQVFTARGDGSVWAEVAVGDYHTVARKLDGTIWTVGWNNRGQLGSGNTVQTEILTQRGVDADWAAISASITSTMGVKTDGTVWGAGLNSSGELGLGNFTTSIVNFTQATGITSAAKLACSGAFTYALGDVTYSESTESNPYNYSQADDCPPFDKLNPYGNNCV